jgi:anti-sigma B factor antagonist
MEQLVVQPCPTQGVDIVVLRGRLDAAVSMDLRDELGRLIADGRTRLALDLAGVTFVDSTGLSVLITTLKTATAAGGDLAMFDLAAAVRAIIELTRLDRVFRICDSRETALEQLGDE